SFNEARIYRKALTADQAGRNTGFNDALENPAEHVALTEPLMTDTRECRVIWYLVLNREPTKPAIGKVHLNLTTQRPFRSQRKHVADNEHPHQHHRIKRGTAGVRVEGRQLGVHPRKVENGSNRSNRVVVRNRLIKAERIEKLTLAVIEPTHHRSPPQRIASE